MEIPSRFPLSFLLKPRLQSSSVKSCEWQVRNGVESEKGLLKKCKHSMVTRENDPKTGLQWDSSLKRDFPLFGRAVSRPFPEPAVLLFSRTEEAVHRGCDTGRKRIFWLGH